MPDPSIFVPWTYMAIPLIATAMAVWRSRRTGNLNAVRNLFVTAVAGAATGMMVIVLYMRALRGHVPLGQVAVTCYWGIAVACVISAVNAMLTAGIGKFVPTGLDGEPCCPAADVAGKFMRAFCLLAIAVPYIGAMALLYRPHVVHSGTPMSLLGADYQNITFHATDGMTLRGWWIPGNPSSGTDGEMTRETGRTVILCHGFGADKASQLRVVRDLVPDGFNVLAFDFRGHGESSGQLCTFGDLERRDVLGAVRWVRATHPTQSRKIFGVGESLGAAALIAAAADPSDEGQAINAIAVFAPFDRLATLIQTVAESNHMPVGGWIARHLALPVAGAHMGTPLENFNPEQIVDRLAPRSLLVIGSENDNKIDVNLSKSLYDKASQPKFGYFMKKSSRDEMLFQSDSASLALRVFFETAKQVL